MAESNNPSSSSKKVHLAVDLGASSGRVVAGIFDGNKLKLEEVYRFENGPVIAAGHMYWDILSQWVHVQNGLRNAGAEYGRRVTSVGVDTWGVDFGLIGRGDELLGNPYHYRDKRTQGIFEQAFEIVPRKEIFAETGLQFMEFNTLFQLLAMKLAGSSQLEAAESLLMIPDLFHWLLTGERANELSNATTTQFYNPKTEDWSKNLLSQMDLPSNFLNQIVPPGTSLGKLRHETAELTGLSNAEVILPGTHDTASAVMAVPAKSSPGAIPDWCYISSGTWSLMGVEMPKPIINNRCRELNFTNEGGVGGTTRLLKNIAGLWLVQECRRVWKLEGKEYSFDDLVNMAEQAEPLVSLINPDHADFVAPAEMPLAIREYCRRTGQKIPQSHGSVIRCALESLALRYRQVLCFLEELTEAAINTIHIVGGGTQNRQLSQMAADACNRPVVSGPVEATAIGNIMMQVFACGDVDSIAQAREVIRDSFEVEHYTPKQSTRWDEGYEKFQQLLEK